MPVVVRTAATLVICGSVSGIVTDDTGTFDGPLSKFAVNVIVPATVPVSSEIGDGNTADVAFAGKVKFTVREPDENCVAGSSPGTSAFEANVIMSWPVRVVGRGAARDSVTSETCVG